MAASTPNGEGGFTYLGVLLLIAISSVALAASGTLWATRTQREQERQLLWVGAQYAEALRSYHRASPGVAQYPQALAELLLDNRFPSPQRHLRRLYPDPITGSADWGLMRAEDGRINGVYSRSDAMPFKRGNFAAAWSSFEGLEHYSDWQFAAEQTDSESAPAAREHTGAGQAP